MCRRPGSPTGLATRSSRRCPAVGAAMTAAELLECVVIDAAGHEIGEVHDLRFESRGAAAPAGYHVTHLMFSPGTLFRRLGYGYGETHGPWLVSHIMKWLAA